MARINDLLKKGHNNEGPGGWQLRFPIVAQAFFALGSSPKELQDLLEQLDRRLREIDQWMNLLQAFGQNALLTLIQQVQGKSKSKSKAKAISPGCADYRIIFIDAYKEGRSVAAQAYAQLVREWTTRTNNKWRTATIHSAGLLIKPRNDVAQLQESLWMSLKEGDIPPLQEVMSALFDNGLFDYPYKSAIRDSVAAQRSRGITSALFSSYDYIFLFNRIDGADLDRIRDASPSKDSLTNTRPKIVFLGEYGTTQKAEIWNPPRALDGSWFTELWKPVVTSIKVSFKSFLKRELAWKTPVHNSQ